MSALTCNQGKAVYHSLHIMERVKRQQASKAKCPLYHYWCNDCKGYHLTKMPQHLVQKPPVEDAKPPTRVYPPGHWAAKLRYSPEEKRTRQATADGLKKLIRRTEGRFDLWRCCVRPSDNERKLHTPEAKLARAKERLVRLREALTLERLQSLPLRDLLRRIDSAWQDRGRYVKSDIIEQALREFRAGEAR